MAYTFPDSIAPYLEQMFVYSLGILAGEQSGGCLEIDRTGKMISTGEKISIPRIDKVSTPQRRDISTTSQTRSFNEMGNSMEVGVVLHDDTADQYPLGNEVFAGLDFQKFWLQRQGLVFARRAKQMLYKVAIAAIEAVDTPTANCHIYNQYSASANQTMTFLRLQDAKAKLCDHSTLLSTCVMHSTCWNNLVKDGISNYKVDSVAGMIIRNGNIGDKRLQRVIRQTMSMRLVTFDALGLVIIVDDDVPTIGMTGSTYTYKTKYQTLLFGPQALLLSYQRGLTPYQEKDLTDARGAVLKMRAEVDYCPHMYGVEWTSATMNPTDAQVATKSNWTSCYTDHREVLGVKLITNG